MEYLKYGLLFTNHQQSVHTLSIHYHLQVIDSAWESAAVEVEGIIQTGRQIESLRIWTFAMVLICYNMLF